MENNEANRLRLSVGEFIALTNQTLEYAFPLVEVEGEVASFKLNQGKYVFFDLKDAEGSIGCFMMAWQLRIIVEDGMKVVVTATPKLTQWGKFSLTVKAIRPSGEGSLKKSFELLKAKLEMEGLFAPERKRSLPYLPSRIGVITSEQAAGYADFVKILTDRWGGLKVELAHVQVQGAGAADQIIRAIKYFNEQENLPEVLVIIRGGGSADDLSIFNDELLVREIAASRVPIVTGIGHEIDTTLADFAADVRAATPSNVAQLLVPDKREIVRQMQRNILSVLPRIEQGIEQRRVAVHASLTRAFQSIERARNDEGARLAALRRVLTQLNPTNVLAKGYAIIRGDLQPGSIIEIEKKDSLIQAEVRHVKQK
jgi:exodeoxyribonuclease VII large subunit